MEVRTRLGYVRVLAPKMGIKLSRLMIFLRDALSRLLLAALAYTQPRISFPPNLPR